jgi:hypothetical protein
MYFAHGEKSPPSLTPNVKAFKIIGDANLTVSKRANAKRQRAYSAVHDDLYYVPGHLD